MGLDMYLDVRKTLTAYDWESVDNRDRLNTILEATGVDVGTAAKFNSTPTVTVEVQVASWRKAYAIHNWMCNNTEEGFRTWVSRDTLAELLADIRLVQADPEQRSDVLPTFDDNADDYDDNYDADLAFTADVLEFALNNPEFNDADFQYTSSW